MKRNQPIPWDTWGTVKSFHPSFRMFGRAAWSKLSSGGESNQVGAAEIPRGDLAGRWFGFQQQKAMEE